VTACKVLRLSRGSNNITADDIECELENARRIQELRHRNIVEVLSVSGDVAWRDWDGRKANFIQMELCQYDLETYIARLRHDHKTITLREYYSILLDVISGIDHLHRSYLIHRDIKAGNST
jgi:serine/threonine protein kinase